MEKELGEEVRALVEGMGPIEVRELPERGPEHLSALLLMVDDLAPNYVKARIDHIESCDVCHSMVDGLFINREGSALDQR